MTQKEFKELIDRDKQQGKKVKGVQVKVFKLWIDDGESPTDQNTCAYIVADSYSEARELVENISGKKVLVIELIIERLDMPLTDKVMRQIDNSSFAINETRQTNSTRLF